MGKGTQPGGASMSVIQAMVERLVVELKPSKIVLFGSHAYGQPHADSDIDLLIIEDTSEDFYRRMARVRKVVSGLHRGIPLGPLVLTPSELEERLSKGDQFIQEILRKGKILYAA